MEVWDVEVCNNIQTYQDCIKAIHGKGYRVSMVNFINNVWAVTYIKPDEGQVASSKGANNGKPNS